MLGLSYLFARAAWHRGYATEAARACRDYAFHILDVPEVRSLIPDFNTASLRAAKRCGMQPVAWETKVFRGREMNFILYKAVR